MAGRGQVTLELLVAQVLDLPMKKAARWCSLAAFIGGTGGAGGI